MKISKIKRLIALGLAITMIASIMPMNLFGISKVFAEGTNLTKEDETNKDKIKDITWTIGSDTESGVFYTLKGKDEINYISSTGTGFSIPENVSFNSIKSVGVDLSFSIVDYDIRKISEGDYLEFVAPEGMEFVSAPTEIKTAVGNYVIGTFSLENNNQALRLTFGNAVDPSNYITGIAGEFTLEMQVSDVTKFGEAHNVVLLNGVGNNTTKVELAFPAATSDIKGVTKIGKENTDINGASWEVSVGTDPQSAGASLAGVTVTDTFDAQDMYAGSENATSVPVVIEGTKADGTAISIDDTFVIKTDEASHTTSLTYIFPADIVAPATLKYDTKYTNRLLKEVTLNKGTKYTVANTATISGDTVTTTDPALRTASATADVTVTTVQKSAKQIDANTMEWTLILNENNNNVWAAVVNDTLMPGLTVDDAYGIHITDLTTAEENTSDKSVVLKETGDAGAKTIASDTVNVSYTDDINADKKQELKISFRNTFNHKYAIVFRTKVAANFVNTGNGKDDDGKDSSADGKNTNVIDNTATVSVSYPTGGGGTGGEAVVYEDTTVKAVFVSAYITETPEEAHTDTGLLDWSVTPSCKTGFDTAKITLDPENALSGGAQELVGTPEVTYKKDDGTYAAVDSSCYSVENNRIFTFYASALDAQGIDFNKVRINYTTKAIDFFKSTSEITYNQATRIDVAANIEGDDMTYTYTSKTVSQKLQNKLIEKTVESVFDDVNNEAYFHFTIPVNKNGIKLTNMELTDDLSSSFYYKVDNGAGIAVDPSWYEPVAAAVPTSSNKYVTHMVVGSTKTKEGITIDGNKITYSNASLNEAGVLHIYVQMTEAGKDALGLAKTEIAKNNNDVKIYVNNTATIKADELLTADKTMSANVESKFDDNSTVVEYKNVDKKGVQGTGAKAPNVTWTININAAFANEDEKQVITDTIPAGLTIDRKSIKLSYGKHGENGTEIVAGDAITGVLDATDSTADAYAYSIASHRDGTTTLKVILPKGVKDESYILTYDTVINKSAVASYSNTLEYTVADKKCNASATIKAKKFVWGSGYPKVLFNLTKLDSLSTATNKIPVAGAHYGLYSAASCAEDTLVTEGYTDGNGQLTLVADQYASDGKTKATYYIKEMKSENGAAIEGSNDISGYVIDENTIYGGYTAANPGPMSVVPIVSGTKKGDYFTDVRKEDKLGTADLNKIYAYDADGISVYGLTSEFNLIIYPKAELGNTTYTQKVIVKETAAGTYEFVGTGDATAADTDTTNVLKNTASIKADSTSDGIGTIKVNKLPWGTYAFVEKSAPDGFVANKTPVKFVVKTDGSVHYLDASGNEMDGVSKGELANNQTRVTLKKTDATGNLLTDYSNVKFTITGPDTSITIDGNAIAIDAKTTGLLGTFVGKFKTGVTYTVTESDTSVPYGYAAVKPFTFTINENTGAVTVSTGAPASVSKADDADTIDTLVTIKEPLVTLTVDKQDQNKSLVDGATLHIADVTEGLDDGAKGFAEIDAKGIPTGSKVNSIADWTCDSANRATDWNLTGQLIAGHTYKITEVNPVTGYIPANDPSKYYVTVQVGKDGAIKATASGNTSDSDKQAVLTSSYDDKNKVLTLKNLKIQANVKLNKVSSIVDKTSNKNITLTGVKYDVYSVIDDGAGNKTETIYKEDVATAAGGVLALSNVPEGQYYAVEKSTLNNYVVDDTHYKFEITASDVNTETGVSNTIIVKDGDKEYLTNEPLPVSVTVNDGGLGATYVLYGADPATNPNQSPIAEKTLAQGETSLTFDNLGWNTNYYVVQKSIPDGYILDKEPKKVTTFNTTKIENVNTINASVTFTNSPVTLKIAKVDQSNKAVNGATLHIADVTEGLDDSAKGFAELDDHGIPTGSKVVSIADWTCDLANRVTNWNLTGQLIAGHTYKITEVNPVTGYIPANDPSKYYVTVQVGKDGAIKATASGNTSDSDKQAVLTSSYDAAKKLLTLKNLKIQANVVLNKKSSLKYTSGANKGDLIPIVGAVYDIYSYETDGSGNVIETLYKADVITGTGGTATISNVPEGQYYAVEKSTLNNYVVDDTHYKFEVTASDVNTETGVSNTIIVKDGNKEYLTNKPVSTSIRVTDNGKGATYDLYDKEPAANVDPIKTLTINPGDTEGTFTGLDWQKDYYVVQKSMTDGYILDTHQETVTAFNRNDVENVDENELVQTVSFVNNPVTLKIAKNNQFGELVTGANLVITDITDATKTPLTWTSDGSQWDLTGQLIAGHTYKITETNALPGYVAANAKDADGNAKYYVTVEVADDGTITATDAGNTSGNKTQSVLTSDLKNGVLTITNLQIKSDAKLEKVSSLDNSVKLSGVTFDLYQKTGAEPNTSRDTKLDTQTQTTSADGKITFTGLYAGNYYVVETATVNNYVLDSKPIEFTVDASSMNHETGLMNPVIISNEESGKYVTNAPKKVSIAITDKCKSDDGQTVVNDNIFGAKYELYDVDPATDGARPKQTIIIDSDTNKNVFTGLDWNKTYYIKQVSVPDGYILDTLVKDVNYNIDVSMITNPSTSLVKTLDCVNTQTNVSFTKIDQEGNAVNGATYTIAPASASDRFADGSSSKAWTSGESGSNAYNLTGQLVAGCSYVITEDSTPAEYLDAKDSHGNRAAKTITVGADGNVTVANGDDSSANMTAACVNNEKTITGCSTAYSADVNMVNTKIYATAKLTKVDSYDKSIKLKGAKFDLYKMNGTEPNKAIDTKVNTSDLVTDVNGEIEVEKLPLGNYYFTETQAPASYKISAGDNIYRFDVDASVNNKVITDGLTVGNERVAGHIIISKTGMGTTVAGAEYTLYTKDSNDQYVPVKRDGKNYTLAIDEANVTKDDATGKYTGTIRFEDLNWGKYYVKETKAPNGYTIDSKPHGEYEIKDGQLSQKATVADKTTSIKLNVLGITAEDENDNQTTEKLDDVEILITGPLNEVDESGNPQVVDSKTFKTDSNGFVEADNEFIVGNEYTVSAVDPHDNYNVIDSFSFKVAENGTVELIDGYVESKVAKTDVNEITMRARKSLFFLELTDVKDKALADGKLAVYEVNNGVVAANPVGNVTHTTKVNGDDAVKIRIEGLMPGDYQLKQSEAPAGYVTAQPISFTLKADNTVDITSGADKETLGTRDSINPKKVATIVMQDPKSQVSIQTLCKPYEKIQKEYGEYEEALNEVNIKIYEDPNCVTGLVYDSSVMELPETSKDLTTADSKNQVTLVSEEIGNKDGRVYIQGLEVGKTYYVQIDSVDDANNVIINKTIYAVTVANDPTKTVWAKVTDSGLTDYTTSSELSIVNDVYRGDVVLTKTDRDDSAKTLAGSVYGIYRKDDTNMSDYIGRSIPTIIKMDMFSLFTEKATAQPEPKWELVSQITTDANGQINFEGIVAGVEYQIKEIDEPEGYQVSKDPITFKLEKTTNAAGEVTGTKVVTISNGNKTAAINEDGSIIWYEPRLKVEINKLDPSGNRLAGATLQVIHKSTGKVVDEWVSEDTQGHVISGLLKGGDAYILREVSAPQGYVCADDITFVAEAKKVGAGENYVQQVTMVDYATKEDERIANANGTNDMATQQVVRVVAPKTNDTNIICEILHLFK